MRSCQAKTGFFILSVCNQKGSAQCSSCGGFFCTLHMKSERECVECDARRSQTDSFDGDHGDSIFGYREEYYERTFYEPLGSTSAYGSLSEADAREFNVAPESDSFDDESGVGFFDS